MRRGAPQNQRRVAEGVGVGAAVGSFFSHFQPGAPPAHFVYIALILIC